MKEPAARSAWASKASSKLTSEIPKSYEIVPDNASEYPSNASFRRDMWYDT